MFSLGFNRQPDICEVKIDKIIYNSIFKPFRKKYSTIDRKDFDLAVKVESKSLQGLK